MLGSTATCPLCSKGLAPSGAWTPTPATEIPLEPLQAHFERECPVVEKRTGRPSNP